MEKCHYCESYTQDAFECPHCKKIICRNCANNLGKVEFFCETWCRECADIPVFNSTTGDKEKIRVEKANARYNKHEKII